MSDLSLATKSLPELREIIEQVEKETNDRLQKQMIAVFIDLRNAAEKLDVSIEQILQAGIDNGLTKFCIPPKKPKKAPIKYRDPQDVTLTWTGRGLPPKWMQAALDKGWSKNDFLIVEPLPPIQYKKPLR
jgi:DNA-binding protein H-NS